MDFTDILIKERLFFFSPCSFSPLVFQSIPNTVHEKREFLARQNKWTKNGKRVQNFLQHSRLVDKMIRFAPPSPSQLNVSCLFIVVCILLINFLLAFRFLLAINSLPAILDLYWLFPLLSVCWLLQFYMYLKIFFLFLLVSSVNFFISLILFIHLRIFVPFSLSFFSL